MLRPPILLHTIQLGFRERRHRPARKPRETGEGGGLVGPSMPNRLRVCVVKPAQGVALLCHVPLPRAYPAVRVAQFYVCLKLSIPVSIDGLDSMAAGLLR